MHILNVNQRKALDKFIAKIPESTVKGNYERWNEKIVSNNDRVTSSDMDSFISLSHGLDAELQYFPQLFSYNVKNYLDFGKVIQTAEITEEELDELISKNFKALKKTYKNWKKNEESKKAVKDIPKKVAAPVKKAVPVIVKKAAVKKVIVPVKQVVKKKK